MDNEAVFDLKVVQDVIEVYFHQLTGLPDDVKEALFQVASLCGEHLDELEKVSN